MSVPDIKAKREILLTGAGFTHNFGGPLAKGMWSEIFNSTHLRLHERIRELLRNNFDFEFTYHRVIHGNFSDPEKRAIDSAVQQAYENLDSLLQTSHFGPDSSHPIHLIGLQNFLAKFAGSRGQPGFIFTLNQDLFLERHQYNPINVRPAIPGVRPPTNVRWFSTEFRQTIDSGATAILPDPNETDQRVKEDIQNSSWCYVKLHGSYGWRTTNGRAPFVIGHNKLKAIFADPLLKIYFEIFKSAMQHKGQRLLVIGYGFGDEHVNLVLAKAVKDYGLELYVICPTDPSKVKDDLNKKKLWSGVHGYFPYTLRQLFPENQDTTLATKMLCDAVFG